MPGVRAECLESRVPRFCVSLHMKMESPLMQTLTAVSTILGLTDLLICCLIFSSAESVSRQEPHS